MHGESLTLRLMVYMYTYILINPPRPYTNCNTNKNSVHSDWTWVTLRTCGRQCGYLRWDWGWNTTSKHQVDSHHAFWNGLSGIILCHYAGLSSLMLTWPLVACAWVRHTPRVSAGACDRQNKMKEWLKCHWRSLGTCHIQREGQTMTWWSEICSFKGRGGQSNIIIPNQVVVEHTLIFQWSSIIYSCQCSAKERMCTTLGVGFLSREARSLR